MRNYSAYPGIDKLLTENRMTKKDLSRKSGIKYDTMLCKLRGENDFTRSEMFQIKSAFGCKIPLDEIFISDFDGKGAE